MAPLVKRVGTPSDSGKTGLEGVGMPVAHGSSSQVPMVHLVKSSGSSSPVSMAGWVNRNGSCSQGFEALSLGHQGVTHAAHA